MTWPVGTVYDVCVFVSFCDGWRGHLATICHCMLFESILCSLSLYSIVTHPDDKNGVYSFRVTSLHPWMWLKLYSPPWSCPLVKMCFGSKTSRPCTCDFLRGKGGVWVSPKIHDMWHVQYIRPATTWSLQTSRRGKICSCLDMGISRASWEVGRFWSFLMSGHTEVWKGSKDRGFSAVLNPKGKHLTSTVETGMVYSFPHG